MFLTSSLIWIVLLCLAVGGGVFGLVYRKDRYRAYPVKWLPSLLRGLLVSSVLFLLLAPDLDFHLEKEEQPVVLWLQDNSTSIARALGKDAATYRAAAEEGIGTLKGKADVRRRIAVHAQQLAHGGYFPCGRPV